MRKLSLFFAVSIAATLLGATQSAVAASGGIAEWNQYRHDAGHTGASEAKGPTWPEVVPGWPVECLDVFCFYGSLDRALASAVLNDEPPGADGHTSLFFGSFTGVLYGFAPNGQYLPGGGWPAIIGPQRVPLWDALSSPAVSTSEGEDRIYVTFGNGRFPRSSIWALGSDGRPLPGWPLGVPESRLGIPTLAEDTSLGPRSGETVYFTASPSRLDRDYLVYALKPDASEKPGWPVRMPKGWSAYDRLAVGPDGTVYVLSRMRKGPSRYAIFAFTSEGEPKEGWPYIPPNVDSIGYPTVGGDGTVYIRGTAVGGVPCEGQGSGLYYAFSPSGSIKPGWPVRLPSSGSAPAIASDGTTYVKTSCTKSGERGTSLYAIDRNGDIKPGWPLEAPRDPPDGGGAIQVVLGANGPGGNERIYTANGGNVLYGYDSHGETLPGYPIRVGREGNYVILGLSLASDNRLYLAVVRFGAFEPTRYFALRSGSPDPQPDPDNEDRGGSQ